MSPQAARPSAAPSARRITRTAWRRRRHGSTVARSTRASRLRPALWKLLRWSRTTLALDRPARASGTARMRRSQLPGLPSAAPPAPARAGCSGRRARARRASCMRVDRERSLRARLLQRGGHALVRDGAHAARDRVDVGVLTGGAGEHRKRRETERGRPRSPAPAAPPAGASSRASGGARPARDTRCRSSARARSPCRARRSPPRSGPRSGVPWRGRATPSDPRVGHRSSPARRRSTATPVPPEPRKMSPTPTPPAPTPKRTKPKPKNTASRTNIHFAWRREAREEHGVLDRRRGRRAWTLDAAPATEACGFEPFGRLFSNRAMRSCLSGSGPRRLRE